MNAKQVEGNFLNVYGALPLRGAVIVAVLVLMKLAIRRLRWQLQFAIFFSFLLAVLSVTAVNWQFNTLPQVARYQVEMEMAFALLIALVGQTLLKDRAAMIAIALLCVAVIQPIRRDRNYARNFLDLDIDITKTSEWKSAQWLNQHWNGERVMMPGSTGFFWPRSATRRSSREVTIQGAPGNGRRGGAV